MNNQDSEKNQPQKNRWQNINRGGFGGKAFSNSARSIPGAVATLGANERMTFVRKTYAHLTGAIFVFAFLEYLFLGPLREVVATPMLRLLSTSSYSWAIVLGAFMGVSWLADKWANSTTSRNMQYLGLGLYVFAESLIFVPLLLIASSPGIGGPHVIPTAAIATIAIFAVLTGIVFITKKDFSFLRKGLILGGFVAMGLIFASIFFGFNLGVIFTVAMIGFAGMYILYHTSQIMAHYHPQQYVAASLALFSSVALLFWYVIRLVMSLSRD